MEQILIGNMNSDDSDKDMPLGDSRLIENLLPAMQVSDNPRSEIIKGTLPLTVSLPAGTNTIIGNCRDRRYSRVFFFIHNSQSIHSIQVFDENNNTVTPVIIFSGLKFDLEYPIGNAGIIDNNLWWVDGKNPAGYIDVARAIAGEYTTLTEEVIRYIQHPPLRPPLFMRKFSDGTFDHNLIADSSWQFAYRYVFKNHQKSVFSPLSKAVIAEKLPLEDDNNNTIEFNIPVDAHVQVMIKEIEVAYRKMESAPGPYYIFETIRNPTGGTYVIRFQNNKSAQIVSSQESSKIAEVMGIPSATASVENRVLMANIEEGFNLDDINIDLDCSVVQTVGNNSLKYSGVYPVGIALYEANGKTTGIVAEATLDVPQHYSSTLNGFLGQSSYQGSASIAATGIPEKYTHFQLLLGREQNYSMYAYFPVNVFFYVSERPTYEGYSVPANHVDIDGRIYLKDRPSSEDQFTYLHLQMPKNVPFIPGDSEFFVRLLWSDLFDDQPVIDVIGDMIVIEDFGVGDAWLNFPDGGNERATIMIEVYKLNRVRSDEMYEIGEWGLVQNGEIGETISFRGDQWGITFEEKQTKFRFAKKSPSSTLEYVVQEGELLESPFLFAPSPTFNISNPDSFAEAEKPDVHTEQGFKDLVLNNGWSEINRQLSEATPTVVQTSGGLPVDYTKFASDRGRKIIKAKNAAVLKRHLNVRVSNSYQENTFINSMHEFDSDGVNLDATNTPITKLARADDKIVLSIHERNVTSLYIGQAVSRNTGGNLIINTDEVIGDKNELVGDYGTINPESVVIHETAVYAFDLLRGEPWRYDNNGITPLAAKYKMIKYFTSLAEGIRKDPALSRPIITGAYDEDREIIFFQFPAYHYKGVSYPAHTMGFSEKTKGWRKYSFGGNFISHINKTIISYRNNTFYLHYQHPNYNFFYGTTGKARIKIHLNMMNHIEKTFKNMGLDSNVAWDVPEITNPKGQKSKLTPSKFIPQDNMFYADFLRDENTNPAVLPPGSMAIMDGDELQSHTLDILMETNTQGFAYLDGVYVDFIPVYGNIVR